MARRNVLRALAAFSCLVGIVLSGYALYVEQKKEKDRSYKAMCDISEHVSCTNVFNSRYGKGFGLITYVLGETSIFNQPNSVFGLVFYSIQLVLGEMNHYYAAWIYTGLAALSNIGSVYLGYILLFILYDFCVICVTTYVLNAMMLMCAIYKLLDAIRKEKVA